MKRLATAVLVVVGMLVGSVSTASAATVVFAPGSTTDAIGVADLLFNGVTYSAEFQRGTYNNLFGGLVYDEDLSIGIRDQIVDAFNLSGVEKIYQSIDLRFLLPTEIRGPNVSIRQGTNYSWDCFDFWIKGSPGSDGCSVSDGGHITREGIGYGITWAVLSPVPLPAALPLLMSALGFFGFMGWRRKQVAA